MYRPAAAVVSRGPGRLPVRARGRLSWWTGHCRSATPTTRGRPRQRRVVLRGRRREDLGEVDPRARVARWTGPYGRAKRGDRRLGVHDFSDACAMGGTTGSFASTKCRGGNAVVDLTDCDREPIHIPGTIQPYGVLFVLAEPALTVAQVSENVSDHFPLRVEDILGQPLSSVIDSA